MKSTKENTPANPEMEKAVVTAVLMNQATLADISGWLTPEMFSDGKTGFIFSAVLALYERGEKPDYLTTEAEMRAMNDELYRKINGISYLQTALYQIRTTINLGNYAKEIKRLFLLRCLHLLFTEAAQKCMLLESQPLEVITEMDQALLRLQETSQPRSPIRVLEDLATEVIEMHRKNQSEENSAGIVSTGFDGLDFIFGGLHKGELYVLGGRPGDGKTAIALQMAMEAAYSGKKTNFFSQEMSNLQLMNRLFTGYTQIPARQLRTSDLTEEELTELDGLVQLWKDYPLYIDYSPANSVENIRAQVLLQKKRGRCDLVILDYLQLLSNKLQKGENLEQVVSRNVQAMKRVALEADCAVLILSQMNRQIESRAEKQYRPNLSDLRDSGAIEQAADGVFFVYRPDRYGIKVDKESGKNLENTCELIVRKNRNGTTGSVFLEFNETFSRFTEVPSGKEE